MNKTDIWVFKHEPKSFDEMILDPNTRKLLEKTFTDVPNIMLVGPPGVGKGIDDGVEVIGRRKPEGGNFESCDVGIFGLGREAEGLDFPPYPGELGKRIYEGVSKEAWKQWLEQQKMLVNENRLSLADKKARDYLAQQMERHFFGAGAETAAGYVAPKS